MTFSYERTWANITTMVRPNVAILLALAGVFLFLPAFALWLFVPIPPAQNDNLAMLQSLLAWYQRSPLAFFAVAVCAICGQAAILVLLLDGSRPTVADAIGRAGRYLLPLLGLTLIVNMALFVGFTLFVLPGLYLLGRFAIVMPVMMAERRASPNNAIRTAWDYTRGLGWRIAGFVFVVWVLGSIALSAATSVLRVLIGLALPEAAKPTASAFADALGNAGLSLLLVVLSAAIYRELRPDHEAMKRVIS